MIKIDVLGAHDAWNKKKQSYPLFLCVCVRCSFNCQPIQSVYTCYFVSFACVCAEVLIWNDKNYKKRAVLCVHSRLIELFNAHLFYLIVLIYQLHVT